MCRPYVITFVQSLCGFAVKKFSSACEKCLVVVVREWQSQWLDRSSLIIGATWDKPLLWFPISHARNCVSNVVSIPGYYSPVCTYRLYSGTVEYCFSVVPFSMFRTLISEIHRRISGKLLWTHVALVLVVSASLSFRTALPNFTGWQKLKVAIEVSTSKVFNANSLRPINGDLENCWDACIHVCPASATW